MDQHKVVTREEWTAARKALLVKEKELTRLNDKLAAERRQLPWVRVDKPYTFDTAEGKATLADLFNGRSQLIVQHFMLGPGWDAGCVGCSFGSDHIEGALVHLKQRDVSYVRISRAPLAEIEAYNRRMGWSARWVSSFGSDFNYDFNVSFREGDAKVTYNYAEIDYPGVTEHPGFSIFAKNEQGEILHTYSTFGRGDEATLVTYFFLDLTPKGRDEKEGMEWVKRHDEYEGTTKASSCCAHEAAE